MNDPRERYFGTVADRCRPIRSLSYPRRRDLSIALFEINRAGGASEENAHLISKTICGVPPENWLTVSEAVTRLRKLGVKKRKRSLYRIAQKAIAGQIQVFMNRRGEWSGSNDLKPKALARILAQKSEAVRFQVFAL